MIVQRSYSKLSKRCSHDAMLLSWKKQKRLLFVLLLIISFSLFFLGAITCFAMDQGGCLTCHRYPGMVRFEKSVGLRVLHIDEDRFLKSAHGSIDCRKCHTKIVRVPHTGETDVECNTACHKDTKSASKVATFPLANFHKAEQSVVTTSLDGSSCTVCHGSYPHSANNMVRALINMHTENMICEVCHIRRENFPHLVFSRKEARLGASGGRSHKSDRNGERKRVENGGVVGSRIALFAMKEGKKRMIMNTWDAEKASKFLGKEKNLSEDERKRQLEYFHKDVARKEISVACDECHSPKGILNFQELGFNEKQAKNLIHLNLKGLVTKYKIFYFPDLFGR
jgi:hypothetical protein